MQSLNIVPSVPSKFRGCVPYAEQTVEVQPDKFITGVTRDSGGSVLGFCRVVLFQTKGDVFTRETTSDVNGSYTFYATPGAYYYTVAYLTGSPDVFGTTVNTLSSEDAPAAVVVATDDFNRADDVTLGANWTFPYSTTPFMFRIVSNQCKSLAGTGTGTRGIFWNASSFANNQYAKVKLITFDGLFLSGFGAAVRCSGTAGGDNFCGYSFESDSANWKLSRQDNGVVTSLATGIQGFAANDIIEVRASGTTISGYKNGVAVSGATASDATYTGGKAGLVVVKGTVIDPVCDDWEGGNL